MALFNYATNFIGQQANASGTIGSGQNTHQVLSNANTYAYVPLGQQPPYGSTGSGASASDSTGGGTVGGQSPSGVSYGSGIGGSGSNSNTTCMSTAQMNPAIGNSSVGQGAEGLGHYNPNVACGPGPGIGIADTNGLNTGASDPTDPTDFLYTDNADGM